MILQLKSSLAECWQIIKEILTLPKRNIFDFVKPYFYGIKLIFVVNFTIERNQFLNGTVIVTRIDKIKTVCLFLLVILLLVQQHSQLNFKIKTNLELLNVGSYLFHLFGYLLILLSSCVGYVMRYNYLKLLNKIYRVDQKLTVLNFPLDINTFYKRSIIFLGIAAIYGWIGYVVCITRLKFNFIDLILEWLLAHLYMLLVSIYYMFLIILYLRYKKLNQCFRFLFLNLQRKYLKNVKTIDQYYYVHTFSSLHMDLTECTVLLNMIFSFMIMICVGICLLFTIFTCYSTYLVWVDYERETMNIAVKNCIIDSILLLSLFVLVVASSIISKEGKQTANILHLALNFSNDEKLLNKFLGFSMQVSHVHPVATCGLFIFDWTLLFSTATTLFTYLIILIQTSFE